jgi:hypothetical protein
VSGMKRYSWFDVYSAAMLETDSSKLDERLDAARRILKVARTVSLSADEHQAIADALNNLFAVEMHEHQTRSRKASG